MTSDQRIDWKRHDEDYLYSTLGHYAVFERPDRKPEHRSPMQRVMRQIKELRGQRYWDHIRGDHRIQLNDLMHESWFQLPAEQKEEHLLRYVDWSGVSERTRDKVIAWQLRSRDGEINARDEWHLHDQLMRVEATTPHWSELSSTAKLETLRQAKGVDWRPFPPEFQAIALGHMVGRVVTSGKDGGFEIGGVFDAGTDYPQFGRYGSSKVRDSYEQSKRKGPKRPVFSKADARSNFRWAVAEPHWMAVLKEHGDEIDPARKDVLKQEFRERMRPLWREFWDAAKKQSREGLSRLTLDWSSQTRKSLEQQEQRPPSPGEIAAVSGVAQSQASEIPPGHAAKPATVPPHPWPSELAKANRQNPQGQEHSREDGNGKKNGQDDGHSM
jgi:hypothetical protein